MLPDLSAAGVIPFLVIGFLLYFVMCSFPTWLAAKMVVSGETTFGSAFKAQLLYFAALIGIAIFGAVMRLMAGGGMSSGGEQAMSLLLLLLVFAVSIMIPARVYEIGGWHAFGLNLFAGCIMLACLGVAFLGGAAVVGMAKMKEPLQASIDHIRQAQETGGMPMFAVPTPAPAPTPPPDYTAEIDGLLNTTLHPTGPKPSLAEREDTVRALQQKLLAQRDNLPSGDAHAQLVLQNQVNRYLALLEAVKAERRLHPLRNEVAGQEVAPMFASPAH